MMLFLSLFHFKGLRHKEIKRHLSAEPEFVCIFLKYILLIIFLVLEKGHVE